MSFDMNMVGGANLSNVQASSKTTDGGAGNTGYFQGGNGDDKETPHFKESKGDLFENSAKQEEQQAEDEKGILDYLKELFLEYISGLKEMFKK